MLSNFTPCQSPNHTDTQLKNPVGQQPLGWKGQQLLAGNSVLLQGRYEWALADLVAHASTDYLHRSWTMHPTMYKLYSKLGT